MLAPILPRPLPGTWKLLLIVALGVASAAATSNVAAAEPQPNFVVILCDDLGYGDLGCYGHPHIRTPHLDRIAAQGIRLTSCYASAPVCSSSRAGLMTGRTPSRVGVYDWIPENNVVHLRRQERSVATLLKQAGYQTAHVGKWHLNGFFNQPQHPQPGDHGFDHWYATQNNAAPSHQDPRNFVRNGKPVGPQHGFSCQLVADEAIDWLNDRRADKPFFLFVCFHEPHEPIASPQPIVEQYRASARSADEAQYFANVTNMDEAVGRIVGRIDQLGLAENTLVLFTSDNGPETLNRYRGANRSFGSPGSLRGMKLWLYEGGIRVPGIIRWLGKVQPGQTVDQPVCGLDVLPTFCSLAGVELPDDRVIDGSDVSDLLHGKPINRKQPLYWHYYRALGEPKAAMRVDQWMILGRRAGNEDLGRNVNPLSMQVIKSETLTGFELYDLDADRDQQSDVADQHPEVLSRLRQMLVRKHAEVQSEGMNWQFD